uniref:Uncharacterized protein n=1 Tax=Rhizophora mucronata TaxID=61149 RepID=A0A2P2ISC0_RHIMU
MTFKASPFSVIDFFLPSDKQTKIKNKKSRKQRSRVIKLASSRLPTRSK